MNRMALDNDSTTVVVACSTRPDNVGIRLYPQFDQTLHWARIWAIARCVIRFLVFTVLRLDA